MTAPIITVDGPSGVGKGTISQRLARTLGWHLLDSGALYRATALAAGERGVDWADEAALAAVARQLAVAFQPTETGQQILWQGRDVTALIRSERCGELASQIAALPQVRAGLLQRQRDFAQPPGLVADGRDMGTVVFPAAILKIYLDATREERAHRRYNQLRANGIDANLKQLIEEIAARDQRDSHRPTAPLKPAPDAVVIDTTRLDISAVHQRVLILARERLATLQRRGASL